MPKTVILQTLLSAIASGLMLAARASYPRNGAGALAGLGAALLTAAVLVSLLPSRGRPTQPPERTLLGAAEAMPGLAIAVWEPLAVTTGVALILWALLSNGLMTVFVTRGIHLEKVPGERLRRALVGAANLLLALIVLDGARVLHLVSWTRTEAPALALAAAGLAMVACTRAGVDLALALHRRGETAR